MKIRTGFVSNSSSSSFCVIGVNDEKLVRRLAEAEGKKYSYDDNEEWDDYLPFGHDEGNVVNFFSRGEGIPVVSGIDLTYFGENKTIREMRFEVQERIKKELGVDVELHKIKLIFGEACGN